MNQEALLNPETLEPVWRIPAGRGRDLGIGIVGCGGIVEYPAGLQALFVVNHDNQHGTPYGGFRFYGTEGALEGTLGLVDDLPAGRPDTLSLHRSGSHVRSYDFDTRWIPDAFLGPMGDLMDAIATGRQPITSGRDNLGTLAVVEAAHRSAAERRSVRVDEITGGGASAAPSRA